MHNSARWLKGVAAVLVLALCAPALVSQALPPGETEAKARLLSSPRHGEWVVFEATGGDKVEAWVVYPERSTKAPAVILIHEIFGLSDWVRAVADQFAAEGFIAIAPDFLSGKGPDGKGSKGVDADGARSLIGGLKAEEIWHRLDGALAYARSLPASTGAAATVGYCWGGGISFGYTTRSPELSAAVVFYGSAPAVETLKGVSAPLLGQYGGNDARVNATIPAAEAELKRLGKRFEYDIYPGAGHGFLRQQSGQSGANLKATESAWPRVVGFLRSAFGDAGAGAAEPNGLASGETLDDCAEFCEIPM